MFVNFITKHIFGISRVVGKREPDGLATREFAKLLSTSRLEIRIVSGRATSNVYESDVVLAAIETARRKHNVQIELFTGPNPNKSAIQKWKSFGATINVLKSWPERHFALIDGRHARIEEPHVQGLDDNKCVQYILYNYAYAQELEETFSDLTKSIKK